MNESSQLPPVASLPPPAPPAGSPAASLLGCGGKTVFAFNMLGMVAAMGIILATQYYFGRIEQGTIVWPQLTRVLILGPAWLYVTIFAGAIAGQLLLHRGLKSPAARFLADMAVSIVLSVYYLLLILAIFLPYVAIIQKLQE